MIDFVIFLFLVGVGYFSIYLFWAVLKVSNKRLGKTIFCDVCFTFASILLFLSLLKLIYGISLLPLELHFGMSLTGVAYHIDTILKKKKRKFNFDTFFKQKFWDTKFFWIELSMLFIGLIIIKLFTGGL